MEILEIINSQASTIGKKAHSCTMPGCTKSFGKVIYWSPPCSILTLLLSRVSICICRSSLWLGKTCQDTHQWKVTPHWTSFGYMFNLPIQTICVSRARLWKKLHSGIVSIKKLDFFGHISLLPSSYYNQNFCLDISPQGAFSYSYRRKTSSMWIWRLWKDVWWQQFIS